MRVRSSRTLRPSKCLITTGNPSIFSTRRSTERTVATRAILEQLRVFGCAEMRAAELRDRAAARRALDEAELQEIRLVHVLDRVGLLAERDGERRQADRAAVELDDDRAQELARLAVEPEGVHLEERERLACNLV